MKDIYIFGEIGTEVTLGSVLTQAGSDEDTRLHINSHGGDPIEAFAIVSALGGRIKEAIVHGACYSAATILYVAAPVRKAYEYAKFLLHNPYIEWASGDAEKLREYADFVEEVQGDLVSIYARTLSISEQEIRALMKRDTIVTAREAANIGLVTQIIVQEEAKLNNEHLVRLVAKYKNKSQKSVKQMGFKKIKIENKERWALLAVERATADGTALLIDSDSENPADWVGSAVFYVGTAELVPDGEYELADSVVIMVADGVISEVREAVAEEGEAAANNDEVAALKAELADLKAKMEAILNAKGGKTPKAQAPAKKDGTPQALNFLSDEKRAKAALLKKLFTAKKQA
ncbi:MAG: hypothetical protein KatS3mg031_2885 [Chitinophagales bacterium]|nr:MAG: hypothetical protein KatS3mg031_2885 [Chitinophagales bacterium]